MGRLSVRRTGYTGRQTATSSVAGGQGVFVDVLRLKVDAESCC